jgi:hypothetical protein
MLWRDILDALDVGPVVLLQGLLFWNVTLATSRYLLATISPVVWNAELDRGRCQTDFHHWLLGQLLLNGVPSYLAAWMWSVPTVVPFIGILK